MSLPRYPEYKDSGVTWLGQVPEHWTVQPLFGVVPERNESNVGMVEDNLLSLSYGRIVRKNIESNDGLLPESFETYQIVRPNDIVFRLTDLQNDKRSLRTAIVEEKGIITSAYVAAKPTGIHARYLNYLLRAYDVTKVFYSMGGGLRQSMKYSDIKRLPTLVPPVFEQTAIATFLDRETGKIDALIAEQEKLLTLLAEKRQATISHAVTKGLNPDAPMKDSGVAWLGVVPEHWSCQKLSLLTEEIGDGLHGTPNYVDDSEYFFINGNNLIDGSVVFTPGTRNISQNECFSQSIALSNNSVLISINGTIGNIALYNGEKIMLGKSAAYINCLDKLNRRFLAYFLQSDGCGNYFSNSLTGTTIKNLSLEAIRASRVPLPSLEEQVKIIGFLDTEIAKLHALRVESERANTLLKERRSALIAAAVTGQIDVRDTVEFPASQPVPEPC